MTRDEFDARIRQAADTRRSKQPVEATRGDVLIAIGLQLCDLEAAITKSLADVAQAVKDSQHVGPKP